MHKKSYNSEYFDNIDSHDKAYWLGFITADGCLYCNGKGKYQVSIKLQGSDKNHLIKYLNCLEADLDIMKTEIHKKTLKELNKVSISNKHLYNSLTNYGLSPRKSTNEIPYSKIPDEFLNDYIRGYFDGDGSIRSDLKNITIVSGYEFLNWISDKLSEKLNIKKPNITIHEKNKNNGLHTICYCKDKVKVLDFLYENAEIYLDRKYDLYKKIKNIR